MLTEFVMCVMHKSTCVAHGQGWTRSKVGTSVFDFIVCRSTARAGGASCIGNMVCRGSWPCMYDYEKRHEVYRTLTGQDDPLRST